MTDLHAAIELVKAVDDEWSAAIDGYWPQVNYDAWREVTRRASETAVARLCAGGALVRQNGPLDSIRFAGVQSTSTCGLRMALSNWLGSARRRLARGAA